YYFNTSGRSIHFPLPTMDGDYIRFTLALVLSIPLALFLLLSGLHKPVKKSLRVFLIFWILAAIVYIHLQAAKSGLIGLYLTGLFYLIVALRKGKYPKLILSGFVIGLLVLILAALKLPNVESQIKRTKYEYEVWSSGDVSRYNKTASFIPRLNSYEVAWVVIKNNWLLGTGAGDIETTLSKNYNELFPSFVKRRQLIPHNQFLYTAVAVGLPLTAILILMVAFPFTQQLGHRIFTWPSGIVLFASLLIEAMLEVQYGVFVYLFFTLFWMSVFQREVGAEKAGLEPGYKN